MPNTGDFIGNTWCSQYNYLMIINYVGPGRELHQYTMAEALAAAGATQDDHPMVQDQLLEDWLGQRRGRVIEFNAQSYSTLLEQAVADGMSIVIIKETPNDQS